MDKSLLEVAHETAKDMYEVGVMDEKTMRKFDKLCLSPNKKQKEIKKLHLLENLNRPIFAGKPVKNIRAAQRVNCRGSTR